jgi:hypothetical protein
MPSPAGSALNENRCAQTIERMNSTLARVFSSLP